MVSGTLVAVNFKRGTRTRAHNRLNTETLSCNRLWPNRIYGDDYFGHVITGFQVSKVDIEGLAAMGAEKLMQLQGQKMLAIFEHKRSKSRKSGIQR